MGLACFLKAKEGALIIINIMLVLQTDLKMMLVGILAPIVRLQLFSRPLTECHQHVRLVGAMESFQNESYIPSVDDP